MQHLKAANNKRRINCVEKCQKLEDMNIMLALDEANMKKIDQKLNCSLAFFSSQLAKKQAKIDMIHET